MKKLQRLFNTSSRLKNALYWLLLGSLLFAIAACAEGGYGYQGYPPPAPYYPTYSPPAYYEYYGPSYPYDDPEYWRRWQDRQGGGG